MKRDFLMSVLCSFVLLAACSQEGEADTSTTSASPQMTQVSAPSRFAETEGVQALYWEDLMPEGEEEILVSLYLAQRMSMNLDMIAEGAANDIGVQIGTFNVVEELANMEVSLSGFAVPLDFSAKTGVREFLLVPSFGQCLHNPPPPPNQTVFVRSKTPIKLSALDDPVTVTGTLLLERTDSDLASAAYVIAADQVERFRGRRRR